MILTVKISKFDKTEENLQFQNLISILGINFAMNTLVRTPLPYKSSVTIVPITAGDTF